MNDDDQISKKKSEPSSAPASTVKVEGVTPLPAALDARPRTSDYAVLNLENNEKMLGVAGADIAMDDWDLLISDGGGEFGFRGSGGSGSSGSSGGSGCAGGGCSGGSK